MAGSCRSIHWVASDGTNWLLRKFGVSEGVAIGSWVVGYDVGDGANADEDGRRCRAVACSRLDATSVLERGGIMFGQTGCWRDRMRRVESDNVLLTTARQAAITEMLCKNRLVGSYETSSCSSFDYGFDFHKASRKSTSLSGGIAVVIWAWLSSALRRARRQLLAESTMRSPIQYQNEAS